MMAKPQQRRGNVNWGNVINQAGISSQPMPIVAANAGIPAQPGVLPSFQEPHVLCNTNVQGVQRWVPVSQLQRR